MALLKLVKDDPNIQYREYRDKLYFRKYKFKLTVKVNDYHKANRRRKSTIGPASKGEIISHWYTPKHKLGTAGRRVEGHGTQRTISLYSNNLKSLVSLCGDLNIYPSITEAIAHSTPGVKYFQRKPKYEYRVYLKEGRYSSQDVSALQTYVGNDLNLIPSPSLQRRFWFDEVLARRPTLYLSGSYYIDYNDEARLSYMSLVFGEMIGKHYKLEKRPEGQIK